MVNLYSRDFYQLAANRLAPQGIVAQWLPLPTQNEEDTRALVASFIEVFPHAQLWTSELHEMLLLGSMQPLTLDAARIQARYSQPDTAALQFVARLQRLEHLENPLVVPGRNAGTVVGHGE